MDRIVTALGRFFHEWWVHVGGNCCPSPDLEYWDESGWTAQQCRSCGDRRIKHHLL